MPVRRLSLLAFLSLLLSCGAPEPATRAANPVTAVRPPMRWDHRPEAAVWTGATLRALSDHGAALAATVPSDVERFCPGYGSASDADRRAFWAGLLSALAKHESTWEPRAAGGGGRWLGLLQIAPATAQGYGCRADTRAELFDGAANLSCGVRIAAAQVGRDAEIVGGPGRWRGMARDWAPFRNPDKVDDIAGWTRRQSYCR
jgi:hypothetical protein